MRSGLVACVLLASCGHGHPPADARAGDGAVRAGTQVPRPAFLSRVPADTPYVYAALTPMPAAYFDREYLSRASRYQPLAEAFARLHKQNPDRFAKMTLGHRLGAALIAELGTRTPAKALEMAGFDRAPRWILYAAGASPVVRVEVRDPARAAATLDRVLAWLAPVDRKRLGDIGYGVVDDGGRRWVFAIAQGELVVAVLARNRFDAELPVALAAREPTRSLASERTLERLAGDIGVAAWSLGFVDTVRLASLLAMDMPAACRDELPAIAALAPRISFGVRSASARQVQMVSLVELRRDVASALDASRGRLAAEPDTQLNASMTLGLAIDVAQASRLLDDAFDRISAKPYSCPALDGLNRLARDQGSSLGWVATSPFGQVNGVTALMFAGDDTGGTHTPSGGVVLFSADQPAALLQAIAGVLPIGIPTTLKSGDAPVVVGGGIALPLSPIHVALGQHALGFAAGGRQAELVELLAATPPADSPIFYLGMHVRELSSLVGASRADPPDPALAEVDADLAARLATIEGESLDRFEEMSIRATPIARGLDMAIDAHYGR